MCFFRAPPRIVRHIPREISVSPSITSRGPDSAPRLFQSPALLSDAVEQLKRRGEAAQDHREPVSVERKRGDEGSAGGPNVLRVMDSLFTSAHEHAPRQARRVSDNVRSAGGADEGAAGGGGDYAVLPTRRSSVFIKSTEGVLGVPDPEAAARYVLKGREMEEVWRVNAGVARFLGRSDHERALRMMAVLAKKRPGRGEEVTHGEADSLLASLTMRL